MTWATQRRLTILLILGAIIIAFLAVVLIAAFSKTPSCSDGIQNQDEAGIDCGGVCAYLCVAEVQPPTVLFTKAINNGVGRIDVVALVENKNATAAAKNVPYRITLYDNKGIFIKAIDGFVDLPPRVRMPVYVSGAASGSKVSTAFLEIAAAAPQWFTMRADPRAIPTVVSTTGGGDKNAPRVEAVLANPSAQTLSNIRAIVLISDSGKSVIATSETVLPTLFAGGQATAVFTWGSAFDGVPSSIEVLPVIQLP